MRTMGKKPRKKKPFSKKLSAVVSTEVVLRKPNEPSSLKPAVSRKADDATDLKKLKKTSAAAKTVETEVGVGEKSKEKEEELSESEEGESTDEESSEKRNEKPPPPSIVFSKKPSAVSTPVLRKPTEPSSLKSAVSRNPDDATDLKKLEKPSAAAKILEADVGVKSKEKKELSESEEEEESTDEESSENDREVSKTSSSSDSGSDRNDEDEDEDEDADADADYDDKQASKTSSSSDSGLGNEEEGEEDIETPISDPSLEPLSNKPVDSSAQPVEKEPNSGKRSAASPAASPVQISKKKMKMNAGIVGAEAGQKKELFKRIWSNEDELALLQGILEYKERHHFIPYSHLHAESLLKSMKDSLSISFSVNQINDKIRRMKKRYNNTSTRRNLAKRSNFSDPHNAVVFNLSKKIWNSLKEESIFLEKKITQEKKRENINKKKGELKHFEEEYPSLYWLLKSEHANNALILQNHIPIADAKKLEEKCKKLETIDTELNMQKIEFLSSAVKLIKDTFAKC